MYVSDTSMEAFLSMNIHECEECGEIFLNLNGIKNHINSFKHTSFKLIDAKAVKKMCCGKCHTNQCMYQISCGPKETDLTWWCPNCKDRIGPINEVEDGSTTV